MFLNSEELRRTLYQHPELPLVVFCEDEVCGEYMWTSASALSVEVGEVFDSVDCPWCPEDFAIHTDRDDWKMAMESLLEDHQGCTEEQWREFCKGRGEIWDECQKFWRRAVIVYVGV